MLMLVLGHELVVNVRDRIPQVFLSLVEERSHVLVDVLSRGAIDLALAYDVPDLPHLGRTELLREDLVLVTLPGSRKGQTIAFTEAMEESLVLAGSGDTIRDLVVRIARELGLEPKIPFEVSSVPGTKNLILRGVAASILPFATVIEEVQRGQPAGSHRLAWRTHSITSSARASCAGGTGMRSKFSPKVSIITLLLSLWSNELLYPSGL